MKKIVTLFVFCAFVALANAKVGYLLRTSTVEGLPTGEQYNERAAAEWFNTNYVETGKGAFIAMNAIPTNTDTCTAIWINIDDNGSGALPSEFNADVKTAIGNFVKAGGNLLLTKRAARVAAEIGRMTKTNSDVYYPDDNEYSDPVRNYVNARLGTSVVERNAGYHPIFENVPLNNSEEGHYLLTSTTTAKSYIWTEMERVDGAGRAANNDIAHLNEFQNGWNCQVLAVWGNVTDFCGPVIVEFYPKGEFKGSIIAIGTRSYVWGKSNDYISNVRTLTSNALSYLNHNGAEIGYYMPYALSELYSTDENHADFQTAKWFYDNYVVTNKGRFIHKEEAFPSDMKVLWVHNDRKDLSKVDFDNAFGGNAFKDTLTTFLSKKGNLYLSKQACYLAYELEKIYEPDTWGNGGYTKNDEIWGINAKYIGKDVETPDIDRSNHPIYRGLTTVPSFTHEGVSDGYDYEVFPLVNSTDRTNNNTIWSEMKRKDGSTQAHTDPTKLANFESDWNCKVLGVWEHVKNFCAAGLIEFNPNSKGGKIIANGFSAYQWGTSNDDPTAIGNVRRLTANILEYLKRENELKDCPNCFPVY